MGEPVIQKADACVMGKEETGAYARALKMAKDNAALDACGVLAKDVDSFTIIEKMPYSIPGEFCIRLTASILCKEGQKPKPPSKKPDGRNTKLAGKL